MKVMRNNESEIQTDRDRQFFKKNTDKLKFTKVLKISP